MTNSVEILRDRAGVPHVYGSTTVDVYFGLGFAMAQDRLWQMDRLRRRALGRQAEILGSAYVESDLLHRAVGIDEIATREVDQTDDATRAILESFVAGINRYIEQNRAALPVEFELLAYEPEAFSVRDALAIMRAECWSLNGRLYNLSIGEAARLLPEHLRSAFLTPEAPEVRILPPGSAYPQPGQVRTVNGFAGTGDGTGSNNWAVAGRRTQSGKALLCSDPHQPFWVPSSWYEYAVHGPEDDAAGAGHPGVPGLWWGSNGDIAWGITNNTASTRDLYREHVHPTDADLYRDGDTWRRFAQREIEIKVRDQAPVRHLQRATVRGPIVNHVVPALPELDEAPLALRWVGQEHLDDVRAAVAIGRARTWQQFRDALRDWALPVFNFGYADAEGHIGYQCAGRVPLRGGEARGYREANDPADTWQGYIPFDGLPSALDPGRGYVASANERVAPDDYPYPLYGSWASGYRAARIDQGLAGDGVVDRTQSIALQNDVKSCRAERLCPPLIDRLPPDSEVRGLLAGWDCRYSLESSAPTVFETFMEVWQTRVLRAYFPERLVDRLHGQSGPAASIIQSDLTNWFEGDPQTQIEAAARAAMDLVRERFGSDTAEWQWGKVHSAHWKHPLSGPGREWLDIGPSPVDGGVDTLRNTGAAYQELGAVSGTEYRLVVDFAEPDRFLAVQNIGNSGVPGAPHYADQFEDWLAGRYHVVSLRRSDIDAESSVLLEPVERAMAR